jgi:hypothetical protein
MLPQCTYTNLKNIRRKSLVSRHYIQAHANCAFSNFYASLTDYVKRFATEEALRETEKDEQSSDESSMSDFSEDETKDMEL